MKNKSKEPFQFNYAICRADGLYYNGNAYGDSRDWTSLRMETYTYSEHGAYRKIALFPAMFENCKVKRFD